VTGPPPQLYKPEFQQEVAKKIQQQQLEQQQQKLLEQQHQNQKVLEQQHHHQKKIEQHLSEQQKPNPIFSDPQQCTQPADGIHYQVDKSQFSHQSYTNIVDNNQIHQTSQNLKGGQIQYQNSLDHGASNYSKQVEGVYHQSNENTSMQYPQQSVDPPPVKYPQTGQACVVKHQIEQPQMVYHKATDTGQLQYPQSADQAQVVFQAVDSSIQQLQFTNGNHAPVTPYQQSHQQTQDFNQQYSNTLVVQQQQPSVQQVQPVGQASHSAHQALVPPTAQSIQPPAHQFQQQQLHLVPLQQVGDALQGLSCIQQVQPVHEMIKEEQTGQLTLMMSGVGVHGVESRVMESDELVRAIEEQPHSQILQEPVHPMMKKIQEIQSMPVQNLEPEFDGSPPIVETKNLAVETPGLIPGGSYLSPGSVGASGTSGYNSQQSTVTSEIGVSTDSSHQMMPVNTLAAQDRDKSVESSLPPNGPPVESLGKETTKEAVEGVIVPNDSDTGVVDTEGKNVRKKTKKERKRTHLGPRIKVLRIVTGEDATEPGQEEVLDPDAKPGVKVECQMETSKQKTVTFEFSTTDIVPEEMATTFINEDLLAEQHKKILVEQLVDIVSQLNENPEKLPSVTFPPEECLSPTREKRERSSESVKPSDDTSSAVNTTESKEVKDVSPQNTIIPGQAAPASPARRTEKPPESKPNKIKRFQVSPVVENKGLLGENIATSNTVNSSVSEQSQSSTTKGETVSTNPHTNENSNCSTTPRQQGDQATATTPHQQGTTPDATIHFEHGQKVQNNQVSQVKNPLTTDNSLETVKKKLEQLELDQASKRSSRPSMNLTINDNGVSGISPASENRHTSPPQLSPAGLNPVPPITHSPESTVVRLAMHAESKSTETEHLQQTHINDVSVMSDLEANLAMVFNHKEPLVIQSSVSKPDPPHIAPQHLSQQSSLSGIIPLDSSVNVSLSGGLHSEITPQSCATDHEAVPAYTQYQVVSPAQGQDVVVKLENQTLQGDQLAVSSETDGQHQNGGEPTNTVNSIKSLEDVMGEPARQSTPVASPERSQVQESVGNSKISRFAVQKVAEVQDSHVVEPDVAVSSQSQMYQRSCSISNDGRVSVEAEHYDSSPSPGSCYDTASESVEPSMLQMYGDQVIYNGPVQAIRTEGFPMMPPLNHVSNQNQNQISVSQESRRPSHSWPATWPDASKPSSTWTDSSGQNVHRSQTGPVNGQDDHHTSGDSIPVGCEASHLDISQDSGMASLIREPLLQQAPVPIVPDSTAHVAPPEQFRQPPVQENFCPGPESTFMPVEPAKEPPLLPPHVAPPSFQITSVKDSLLRDQDTESRCNSIYGSRESLLSTFDRPRSTLHPLPLPLRRSNKSMPKLSHLPSKTHPASAGPSSPRPERRSDPTPPTGNNELSSRASQLHQKNMSELNKGLDSIFHLKSSSTPYPSRPPSRASVYEEQTHIDFDSGYMTCHIEPEKKKTSKSPRGLFKSHSRASIFEDNNTSCMDDCEVYHTVTGGKSNSLAATRAPLPFAKITRRPTKLLAHMSSFADEAAGSQGCDPGDFDTESVISLNDDLWRLDVESVEDDHNEITEEESFIQNALNRLDQRHAAEMEILQRRMEELQRHYMKEKENLRVDLVSTLLNARKVVHQQQQQDINSAQQPNVPVPEEASASPQLLQLQQQKELIQQQINEHMRQQHQVQQQQQNFQQSSTQQQPTMQQPISGGMFSPPPGHQSRSSHPTSSPGQQVLQPVPARYAYVSTGGQPQLITINGQQLQVVGGLTGQQILAVQGSSAVPQQFYSLTQDQVQQLAIPRPQSFAPTRFSPRTIEQEPRDQNTVVDDEHHRAIERLDAASVMSEPSRPVVIEQHKRDSFSDSGAEGSGHNTPTRGRTITEGLLRYVQDSSVARPQQRYSNVDNPVGHPGLQNAGIHAQMHSTQRSGNNLGFQTPHPGLQSQGVSTLHQIPPNYIIHNSGSGAPSMVSLPSQIGSATNVAGQAGATLHQVQSIGVVQQQPVNQRQGGRESVPVSQGRESVPLAIEAATIAGRDSVPLGLTPLNIPPSEPQARHVPVIQAVPDVQQSSYSSVIQQNYLPGTNFSNPSVGGPNYSAYPFPHNVAAYPIPGYQPTKIGSAPPYSGPAPGFSNNIPVGGFVYNQLAGSNPLQTYPPGPMCSTSATGGFYPPPLENSTNSGFGNHTRLPGYPVASPPPSSFHPVTTQNSTGEVTTIRQPIMSSNAQPSHVPSGYTSMSGMIPVMMVPPSGIASTTFRYPSTTHIPGSPLSPPAVDSGALRSQHPTNMNVSQHPPVPHGSVGHGNYHAPPSFGSQPNVQQLPSGHIPGGQQPLSATHSMSGSYHEGQGPLSGTLQDDQQFDAAEKPA